VRTLYSGFLGGSTLQAPPIRSTRTRSTASRGHSAELGPRGSQRILQQVQFHSQNWRSTLHLPCRGKLHLLRIANRKKGL
jgi:hypothetical protein